MVDSDSAINISSMAESNSLFGSTKITPSEQMDYTGCTSPVDIFFMPGGLTPGEEREPLDCSFLRNCIQVDANDFYFFFGGNGGLSSDPKSGLFFHCSRFISPLFGSNRLAITLVIYPVFRWGGVDLNDFFVDLSSKRLGHYLAEITRNNDFSFEFDLVYLKKDLFISNDYHTIIENGIRNGIKFLD